MGKMKRPRQRLHNAKMRTKAKERNAAMEGKNNQDMEEDSALMPPPPPPADPTAVGARGENLFANIKIGASDLVTQKLPDFDARSTITSKTFKGMNLTKKEKQKIRHEAWMSKMNAIDVAKKQEKEKKKRQKTPVVGDMKPLEDALPTLELLLKKSSKKDARNQEKPRSIAKMKKRQKQMMDDISLFQRVQDHPLFKENAGLAIQTHLRNKLQMEQKMDAS